MVILTNCLKPKADEGCLKVAAKLTEAIKKAYPSTTVIGYERQSPLCDHHLELNKSLLNGNLQRLLRKIREPILFIPFSAKMRSNALRTLVLSVLSPGKVTLLQSMYSPMGRLPQILFKLSRAEFVCLSRQSYLYYREKLGERVRYLQTGVDTEVFCPVLSETKLVLRRKYGLPPEKPIVLHVGHLKKDRNLDRMLELEDRFHGVAVVSTHDPQGQDGELAQKLQQKENITLMQGYYPNVEEFYQLADVYLFPVRAVKGCIDVPLSAMEAAACGLPLVTTPFGELKNLIGKEGVYLIEDDSAETLNRLIGQALIEGKSPRETVEHYDWKNGAATLFSWVQGR